MSISKKQWIWRQLKKILQPFRMLLAASLISSCATHQGKPLASLCIMDFDANMCWVDRSHGKGFSFEDMSKEDSVSWFGLNQYDLERIEATLNK